MSSKKTITSLFGKSESTSVTSLAQVFGAEVSPKGILVNWYCLSSAENDNFSWSHGLTGMLWNAAAKSIDEK